MTKSFSNFESTLGAKYREYGTCLKKKPEMWSNLTSDPCLKFLSSDQLDKVPIDNKVGENYFGELTDSVQLIHKGGALSKAIGELLVLSSNPDLAFCHGAEQMLADKELK